MFLKEKTSSAVNRKHEEQHKGGTKIIHFQQHQRMRRCELESY